METVILERGTIRDQIQHSTGDMLVYPEIAVFNTIGVVLERRLGTFSNDTIPYVVPSVIDTIGIVLNRRTLINNCDLVAYTSLSVFSSEGVETYRLPLPVLNILDDAQILARGGTFDLDFSAQPRRGMKPLSVQFTNKSQAPINVWYWEFGDGNISTEKNPINVYLEDGRYDVTLRAGSPEFGFAHITKYEYIIVGFKVYMDQPKGMAPLIVKFQLDFDS